MNERNESPSASPIARFFGSKLGRNFTGTIFWHVLARIVQVVGMGYAARCLGKEAIGHSGTVMTVATCVQQVLGFGFEIALVRHFARGRDAARELLPAVFTFRGLVAMGSALVWVAASLLWAHPVDARWVWLWGAPNLAFLLMDYSWVFQAEERMPVLTRLQLWITGISSLIYLVAFRPQQTPGSDLAVSVGVNVVIGIAVWRDAQRRFGVRLWDLSSMRRAWDLVGEGRPVWLYNVTYWVHHMLQLPLVHFLLGPDSSGLYRSAAQLVMSAQAVIVFFLQTAYPRMIEWRRSDPVAYVRRIWLMSIGWFAAGWVAYAVVFALRDPIYHFIYGSQFAAGASILPVLLLGKFVAAPNGMFLWALFADHRDWTGVRSVAPLLALESIVNCLLIPHLTLPQIAWLSVISEGILIVITATAFQRASRELRRATPAVAAR